MDEPHLRQQTEPSRHLAIRQLRGVFMARRGLVALSLPFGDAEAEQFAAVLDDALAAHQGLLPVVD